MRRCICVLLLFVCLPAALVFPETPAFQRLPQAQPGLPYVVQLAIPPGLGYPFQECKLSGDPLPKGLAFDCARLQLKGRAPAGGEKTIVLVLLLIDAQGNSKTFQMELRISSKPEMVILGTESPVVPISSAQVAPLISPEGPTVAVKPEPIVQKRSSEEGNTVAQDDSSRDAENLQNAAATLQPISLATPKSLPAKPVLRARRLHPFIAVTAQCTVNSLYTIPQGGAADDESSARSYLIAVRNESDPQNNLTQFHSNLQNLYIKAPQAAARLHDCAANEDNALFDSKVRQWFSDRADAWDALVKDMKTNVKLDSSGNVDKNETYQPSDDLAVPLLDDRNPVPRHQFTYQSFGIVGTTLYAASGAGPESKLFAEIYADFPFKDISSKFWYWGYGRIGSVTQTQFNAANVYNQASTALTSNAQQLVQSAEMAGGFEFRILPWHNRHVQAGYPTLSFIAGGGAITPLTTSPSQISQAYFVTPDIYNFYANPQYDPIKPTSSETSGQQSIGRYTQALMKTCGETTPPPITEPTPNACYVSFYPQDRSRFFRHYEGGLRLKVPLSPAGSPLTTFPAQIDTTFGQNEYVTRGQLRNFVLHVGAITPLPYADKVAIYAFGGMDFGVNGHGDPPGPLLLPAPSNYPLNSTTPTPTASTANTVNIQVPQPNRDRYALGLGWDILGLVKNHVNNAK